MILEECQQLQMWVDKVLSSCYNSIRECNKFVTKFTKLVYKSIGVIMTLKKVLILGVAMLLMGSQVVVLDAKEFSMSKLRGNVGIAAITNEVLDASEYLEYVDNTVSAAWGYDELGIATVTEGNLNVREMPTTSSKVVGKMYNNAACEILGEEGEWYHIRSGEVEGYVSSKFIITGIKAKLIGMEIAYERARVLEDGLNVRTAPSEDSEILTKVAKGEELEVIEELDGWIKCKLNTDEVYVSADYVEIVDGLNTAITITQFKYGMDVSDVRVDLCEYALQFVGNPYVWGGTSLTKGADCSGFVLSVYKNYGIELPHYSRSQSNHGTEISYKDAQPGDLLFYGSSKSTISHVAIYLGDGQIVHANDEKTGIIVSNAYYRTPVKACTLLED